MLHAANAGANSIKGVCLCTENKKNIIDRLGIPSRIRKNADILQCRPDHGIDLLGLAWLEKTISAPSDFEFEFYSPFFIFYATLYQNWTEVEKVRV